MSKNTLYVTNLSQHVDESTVERLFVPFGDITSVVLPKQPNQARHKGYALVEFADPLDARQALDNMHQAELDGEVISVQYAKPSMRDPNYIDATKSLWSQEAAASAPQQEEQPNQMDEE